MATECSWFSIFFEKALVNRVNRRMDIRMVRFCRSIMLVETWANSGLPEITARRAPMHWAGEYRTSLRGKILRILDNGHVVWRPDGTESELTALPESLCADAKKKG